MRLVRMVLAAWACVSGTSAALELIAHNTNSQPALHETQKAVVGVGKQPDVLFWKLHKVVTHPMRVPSLVIMAPLAHTSSELRLHQPGNSQRRARGGVSTRTDEVVESVRRHPSVRWRAVWGARACTRRQAYPSLLRGAAGDLGVSSGSSAAAADGLGDMGTPALNIEHALNTLV